MSKKQNLNSAGAAKTVDNIIEGRSFGNLSKTVPLTILAAGFAVAFVVVALQGGEPGAWIEGGKVVVAAVAAGVVGSATTYLGDSQTQKDLKAVRAATTETVGGVASLPADSPLLNATNKSVEPVAAYDEAERFATADPRETVLEFAPEENNGSAAA